MPNHSFTHRHRLYDTLVEATTYMPGTRPVWWLEAAIENGDVIDEDSHLIIVSNGEIAYPMAKVYVDSERVIDCMNADSFEEHFVAI